MGEYIITQFTKKFYCIQLQSIITAFQRNKIVSVLLILIKEIEFFFLCISQEVLIDLSEDDTTLKFFKKIDIFDSISSDSYIMHIQIGFLVINLFMILYLLAQYIQYIYKQFRDILIVHRLFKTQEINTYTINEEEIISGCLDIQFGILTQIMSFIITSYQYILQIPILFFCIYSYNHPLAIINSLLSFIIGFIIRDSDYNFTIENSDYMAKPFTSYITILYFIEIITIALTCFTTYFDCLIMSIYYCATCFIKTKICPYYKETTQFWNIFINIYFGILSILILLISLGSQKLNLFGLSFIFLLPFSFKISGIIIQYQNTLSKNLMQSIYQIDNNINMMDIDRIIRLNIFEEADSKKEDENRKISILNLVTNKISSKQEKEKEETKKEQDKQTQQSQRSQSLFQSTNFKLELKEQEISENEFVDVKLFIKEALLKISKLKQKYYQKIVLLIYLLEIMKNTKAYWMEYSNICKKNLSIKERQIFNQVHILFLTFKNILQQTHEMNSPFDKSFSQVLNFEQKMDKTYQNLDVAIKMKVELLSMMKQKTIIVQQLIQKANSLRQEQQLLRTDINLLAEINSESSELLNLQLCYLENLSFCDNDIKMDFNSFYNKNRFSQKTRQRQIKMPQNNQKNNKIDHQREKIKVLKDDNQSIQVERITEKVIFDQNSCVVFASLEDNTNLVLKKVSQNFCDVFQLTQKEALGKKIDLFMPQNTPLPQKHKKYVQSYFANSDISYSNLSGKLLFGQSAKGNIIPMTIDLKLNYAQELKELGFCALFRVLTDNTEYLLFNSSSLSFIGITNKLQQSIFQKYAFHKKYDLGIIFPFLYKIRNFNHQTKTNTDFKTEWDAQMTTTAPFGEQLTFISDLNMSTNKKVLQKEEEYIKRYENQFEYMLVLENRKDGLNSYQTTHGQNLYRLLNEKEYLFYLMDITICNANYKELSNLSYLKVQNIRLLKPSLNYSIIQSHLKENIDMYLQIFTKQNLDKLIQQIENKVQKSELEQEQDQNILEDSNNQAIYGSTNTFNKLQSLNQLEKRHSTMSDKILIQSSLQLRNTMPIVMKQTSLKKDNHLQKSEVKKQSIQKNQEKGQTIHKIVEIHSERSLDISVSKLEELNLNNNKQILINDKTPQNQQIDYLLSPSAFSANEQSQILSPNQNLIEGVNGENVKDIVKGPFLFSDEELKQLYEKKDTIRNKNESKMSTNFLQSPTYTKSNQDLLQRNRKETLFTNSFALDASIKQDQSMLNGINNNQGNSQLHLDISNSNMAMIQQKFYQEKLNNTGIHIIDDFRESRENLNILNQLRTTQQKNNKLEQQIEIQSTKSRESSTSTKKQLIHLIKARQQILAMKIINILGFTTFLVLIFITVQQYITIIQSLTTTQDNLSVLNWPQDVQTSINRLQYNFNTLSLIRQNEFQFDSSDDQNNFDALMLNRLGNVMDEFIDLLIQMESTTVTGLFIILNNIYMTFQNAIYYDPKNIVGASSRRIDYFTEGINVSLLYSTILFSQYVYRQSLSPGARFQEYLTIINLELFVDKIQIIQDEFQGIQEELDQTVESKLEQLLIIILIISFVCLTIIVPVYSFIQGKKDIIINLFSTFPTTQLQSMILRIRSSYYQNKHMLSHIRQTPKEIQLISTIYNQEQNHIKKQTLSYITKLPRFKILIFITLIMTYLLLSLYPIVNKIITQNFVDEQRSDIQLFININNLREFILSSAGMFQFTLVMRLYPDIKVLQIDDYIDSINELMDRSNTIVSLMQNITEQQTKIYRNLKLFIQKRYNEEEYSSFFFSIFEGDICKIVDNYPKYHVNQTSFQIEVCQQIQNGFLSKGLKLSVQKYLSYLSDLNQVIQTKDANILVDVSQGLFQTFNITDYTLFVDYLAETLRLLQNFIQYNNNDYFNYVKQVQLSLLIYQIILMVLVFGVGWNLFTQLLNSEVTQTKQYLQIVNIEYLLDNNYILTFVKNNHKI